MRMRFVAVTAVVVLAACADREVHGPAVHDDDEDDGDAGSVTAHVDAGAGEVAADAGSGATTDAGTAVVGRTPSPMPPYSHGTCPALVGGSTKATSLIEAFPT